MLPTHKPYIIGETAFHHEGEIDFLKKLIDHAKNAQIDAIKFHLLLDLDDYMTANHEAIEVLRPWCLKEEQWDEILDYSKNIDIIALCNDVASINYINNSPYAITAIEIHATGINDIFLLEKAASFKHTVILGTGGSTIDEIDFAIQFLKSKGKNDIFLMHGFQSYPTNFKDIKLNRMSKLNHLFSLPIGYADHTDPHNPNNEFISCLGIAQGFNVLEKHFTHKFGEKRIDSQSAINIEQLKKIKELSEIVFSTFDKENSCVLTDAEQKYGNTGPMKKAIVARKNINKGELLTLDHIAFKRTNSSSSLKQIELTKLLNNKTSRAIDKDEIIDLSNTEYTFTNNDFSQFKNTLK